LLLFLSPSLSLPRILFLSLAIVEFLSVALVRGLPPTALFTPPPPPALLQSSQLQDIIFVYPSRVESPPLQHVMRTTGTTPAPVSVNTGALYTAVIGLEHTLDDASATGIILIITHILKYLGRPVELKCQSNCALPKRPG
jgi:hypothetical protein